MAMNWNVSPEQIKRWQRRLFAKNRSYERFKQCFIADKVFEIPDPFENIKDGVTGEIMPLSDHIIKAING